MKTTNRYRPHYNRSGMYGVYYKGRTAKGLDRWRVLVYDKYGGIFYNIEDAKAKRDLMIKEQTNG